MSSLTSFLVTKRVVSFLSMDAAVQRMQREGGRLSTSILEESALAPDELASHVARLAGLVPVTDQMLASLDAELVESWSASRARRLGAIPLRIYGHSLDVGVLEPLEDVQREEISEEFGCDITQYSLLEFRFFELLARFYQIPVEGRYLRLASRFPLDEVEASSDEASEQLQASVAASTAAEAAEAEVDAEVDAALAAAVSTPSVVPGLRADTEPQRSALNPSDEGPGAEAKPGLFFELDGVEEGGGGVDELDERKTPAAVGTITHQDLPNEFGPGEGSGDFWVAPGAFGDGSRSSNVDGVTIDSSAVALDDDFDERQSGSEPAVLPGAEWTLDELGAALSEASSRDEALRLALGFSQRFFKRALVLRFSGNHAVGHMHFGYSRAHDIRDVIVSAPDGSGLDSMRRGQKYYHGPASSMGLEPFYREFVGGGPPDVVILPVEVAKRVVLVIVGDAEDTRVDPQQLPLAFVVVNQLAQRLDGIIRSARGEEAPTDDSGAAAVFRDATPAARAPLSAAEQQGEVTSGATVRGKSAGSRLTPEMSDHDLVQQVTEDSGWFDIKIADSIILERKLKADAIEAPPIEELPRSGTRAFAPIDLSREPSESTTAVAENFVGDAVRRADAPGRFTPSYTSSFQPIGRDETGRPESDSFKTLDLDIRDIEVVANAAKLSSDPESKRPRYTPSGTPAVPRSESTDVSRRRFFTADGSALAEAGSVGDAPSDPSVIAESTDVGLRRFGAPGAADGGASSAAISAVEAEGDGDNEVGGTMILPAYTGDSLHGQVSAETAIFRLPAAGEDDSLDTVASARVERFASEEQLRASSEDVERVRRMPVLPTPEGAPSDGAVSEASSLIELSSYARSLESEPEVVGTEPQSAPTPKTDASAGPAREARQRELAALNSLDEAAAQELLAHLSSLPEAELPNVVELFPGRIDVDYEDANSAVIPIYMHGPLLRLCYERLSSYTEQVWEGLDKPSSNACYYALRLLAFVRDLEPRPSLIEKVFHEDNSVRRLALQIVFNIYERAPNPEILAQIRAHLDDAAAHEREAAVVALTKLRDRFMIPQLIDMLVEPNAEVRRRALEALQRLTFQVFGYEAARWMEWFEENRELSDEAWLAAAMTSERRDQRVLAAKYIDRSLGFALNYHADISERQRSVSRRALETRFGLRKG